MMARRICEVVQHLAPLPILGGIVVCLALALSACVALEQTDTAEQAFTVGDMSIADQRDHFGIGSTAGFSTRRLAALYPKVVDVGQVETDLNDALTAASLPTCTSASGCLQFVYQDGSAPASQDNAWALLATQALIELRAGAKFSPLKLYIADTADPQDVYDTFVVMSEDSEIVGATIGVTFSPTHALADDMDAQAHANPKPYTVPSIDFPAASPEFIAVGGISWDGSGVDSVWSGSQSLCRSTFGTTAADEAESLCASGERIGVDLVGPSVAVPYRFNGSNGTNNALTAAAAFQLGQLALQSTAIADRAKIFSAAAGKFTDVTSGTDASSHTAVSGKELATFRGRRNQTQL